MATSLPLRVSTFPHPFTREQSLDFFQADYEGRASDDQSRIVKGRGKGRSEREGMEIRRRIRAYLAGHKLYNN